MKKEPTLLFFLFLFLIHFSKGQGIANNWQIGYSTVLSPPYDTHLRGNISFTSDSIHIQGLNRKMKFGAAEGNISDRNGKLLFVSNGIWIANSLGDTMQNGSGLNPGAYATQFYNDGSDAMNTNLVIPMPGDSNKYILFHSIPNANVSYLSTELYYSEVDMSLDGGLGAVTLKNQIVFSDTLMTTIAACKHANGRDWWVVMLKNASDIIYKVLVSPLGIVAVSTQSVGGIINYNLSVGQCSFSPDGKKFGYTSGFLNASSNYTTYARLLDFDRCTGTFSNFRNYHLSNFYAGYASAFSANSKYLYACTVHNIFQINADSLSLIIDTVATNDVFYSPFPATYTDFGFMYRALDDKIYVASGNSVLDLHYINQPDSAGVVCDVHLHAMHLPCFNFRTVPNHPNYDLGADSGSVCDSLQLGIKNPISSNQEEFIQIHPNPVSDYFYVNYSIPVRDNALFIVYDTFGHEMLRRNLYGTMKTLLVHSDLPETGVYYYTVTVRNKVLARNKIVIAK